MAPCLLEMTSLSDELVPALEEEDPDAVDLRLNQRGEGVVEQPRREVLLDGVLEVLGDIFRKVAHRRTPWPDSVKSFAKGQSCGCIFH
jgi:hypothetical protein